MHEKLQMIMQTQDQHSVPETIVPFDLGQNKLKKIALICGNYNYVIDGPVRALNRLVAFLERQGIEVLVFAPTAKTPALKHNGTLISVPSFPIPGRSEYRVAMGLPAHIRHKLEEFKPDMIHLTTPDLLGTAALKWANRMGIPAVSSFHTRFDTYPRYYNMAWLEKYLTNHMRRFYHRCEHVYAPSQSMIDVLQEQKITRTPDNLRIWTRGVESDVFNPQRRDMQWRRSLGIADDKHIVLFVGRLVLEKGLGVFADVLDRLESRNVPVHALIVGEGPERERFQKRLPNATFTGFLQGADLGRAYASSDLFFNASITETFGNVTLEAMACGVPAVCADATGSRTLVAHEQSGFLVDYDDLDGFTDRIEQIVTDKALKERFQQNSIKRAEPYNWENVLTALVQQYGEAVTEYNRAERVYEALNNADIVAQAAENTAQPSS